MRLGTETGSLTNAFMEGGCVPEEGMGCTILGWTDRYAATIVRVTTRQLHVQRDIATRIDKNGFSESQEYRYERNPAAYVDVFRLTKRGWRNKAGNGLRIGERDEYYDFSF